MTHKEVLTALVHEMEYVLSCINADKVPFDGDDFHEALRLGKEVLSQTENDKERCVGCEACIDTACGRDECPNGWPKAAQPEQEPVAWVPYLSDRADGVKGRYAIARWNPRGYREVWNLRRHEWGAYSDDVLSLEEADTLLRLITIPTRKVTSPQPPQPKEPEQEPVAWAMLHDNGDFIDAINPEEHARIEGDYKHALYTTPPQRKPLAYVDLRRVANQCGLGANEVSAQAQAKVDNFARAIEAAHGIKG